MKKLEKEVVSNMIRDFSHSVSSIFYGIEDSRMMISEEEVWDHLRDLENNLKKLVSGEMSESEIDNWLYEDCDYC